MTISLYNTLTRQKEPLQPAGDPLLMYVCGVTPYADAHLGHAMSAIIFDVLRRYLEWRGRRVRFVYNYTDIDDKMIARATRLGISIADLAADQIRAFELDMRELNIRPADVHPRATQEIPKMLEIIEGLIDGGMAYPVGSGDVYFRVTRRAGYGKLSHRSLEDMIAGARVEVDSHKEHPMDFVLWKSAKPGEPAWESPWGPGRPGWHIECSAMALRYLGEQIDLHGGGMDLIFPHHENEIAQSESFTEQIPFVRHWVHNALMQLGEEKMSKSLGNIIGIRSALDAYGPDAIRLFVLSGHYRTPLRYSEEGLAAAQRGAERLRIAGAAPLPPGEGEIDPGPTREQFMAALDDDLGTPQALALLFDLAREINRARDAGQPAGRALAALHELGGVLGLQFLAPRGQSDAAPFIALAVEIREALRREKQFALADQVRAGLAALGVSIEDGRDGSSWRFLERRPVGGEGGAEEAPASESTLRF